VRADGPGGTPTAQVSADGSALSSGEAELPRSGEGNPARASDGAGRAWPAPLRGMRAAFIFFSRLPVGGFPYCASDWHWAPAHLPLVGGVVGGVSAAVFALGSRLSLAPLLCASLALAVAVWLTGALHEDGLADSADGLGGAPGDRQRALDIMKDSRIGTYGATTLLLSLMLRASALSGLRVTDWFAIVYVHVWARTVPVWLLCTEPYVNERPDAKSQGLFQTRALHVFVALAWGVAAAALGVDLGWLPGPAALGGALAPLAITPLLARYFRRRIGGVTGDLLGAAEQIAEVVAWVAVCAALNH
jgi:adenosylcobinamide-GDP ribazoletransferase